MEPPPLMDDGRREPAPSDRHAALSPERQALLARLRTGQAAVGTTAIPRLGEAPPRLSPQQEATVAVLDRLAARGGADPNIQTLWADIALTGPLDIPRLARSLETLIERHAALRTTFRDLGDGVRPIVTAAPRLDLDLREDLDPAEPAPRPRIDVANGPPIRFALSGGGLTHRLSVNVSHLVFDGWSYGLLLRELADLYAGRASAWRAPPIDYTDYAAWHARQVAAGELEHQRQFWRRMLLPQPPLIEIPTTRARSEPRVHRLQRRDLRMDPALVRRMEAYAREKQASLFTVGLTAFNLLISRRSGCDDLAIISSVANRNRPETQHVIGKFANEVIFRTDLRDADDFPSALERTHKAVKAGVANQEYPYRPLTIELFPDTYPFRLSFTLQNYPVPTVTLDEVVLEPIGFDFGGTSSLDLAIFLWRKDAGMETIIYYNGALFDAEAIDHIHQEFEAILAQAVRAPHTPAPE